MNSVTYKSYTVDDQTGRLTRWKPDSPAAAWYCFIFFTKFWLGEPKFHEKDLVSSTLLEAKNTLPWRTA